MNRFIWATKRCWEKVGTTIDSETIESLSCVSHLCVRITMRNFRCNCTYIFPIKFHNHQEIVANFLRRSEFAAISNGVAQVTSSAQRRGRTVLIADSDDDNIVHNGDTKSNHSTFIAIDKIHIFLAHTHIWFTVRSKRIESAMCCIRMYYENECCKSDSSDHAQSTQSIDS